jgi:hypothetical protein
MGGIGGRDVVVGGFRVLKTRTFDVKLGVLVSQKKEQEIKIMYNILI